jgi:hypothetical protein
MNENKSFFILRDIKDPYRTVKIEIDKNGDCCFQLSYRHSYTGMKINSCMTEKHVLIRLQDWLNKAISKVEE